MINISKPFAALVTALKQDKFRLATLKLTFFYVLSTAVILFISSAAVLILFAPPETELPFRSIVSVAETEHEEWSLYEVREHLLAVIMLVDVSILLVISAFAYSFARRTLLPIKNMHEEQQRFMSDVAHELRTPLSVMQVGADTVLRKPRSTSAYQEFITDIQEETGRLTRLSNQLLQLLRTGTGVETVFAEVTISKIFETEVRRFTAYAQEQGVTIVNNIEPGITVRTERDCLTEIIQNLLKNALDYNKQGGTVTATLFQNESSVMLEIKDTGVGISSNAQTQVFNRFVKGDAARTQTTRSGAGLGLSIVKALVIKLKGQIALTSTLGVGTTITVTLPKTHS